MQLPGPIDPHSARALLTLYGLLLVTASPPEPPEAPQAAAADASAPAAAATAAVNGPMA